MSFIAKTMVSELAPGSHLHIIERHFVVGHPLTFTVGSLVQLELADGRFMEAQITGVGGVLITFVDETGRTWNMTPRRPDERPPSFETWDMPFYDMVIREEVE